MARRRFRIAEVLLALVALSLSAGAQDEKKNELGGVVGRTFISNQPISSLTNPGTIHFGAGTTFEINYARVLRTHGPVQLAVEVPLIVNVDQDLNYPSNAIPEGFKSYFITPSARVKFSPNFLFSPWVSVGGGFGHFSESDTLVFGGQNPGKTGTTTGVFQVGGGLDINPTKSLTVRVEVRLLNTSEPQLNVNSSGNQNNIFTGGGVVWRF